MKLRVVGTALLIGILTTACSGGGTASVAAASNGYGSGAAWMIHVQLRTGTSGEEGSAMSKSTIARPGVVFTNFTPADGMTVGVKAKGDLALVEQYLRAQPAVATVTDGPAPTAPPAPGTS